MATPRPETYTVASGADLWAGRDSPATHLWSTASAEIGTPPTAENGWLWTPGRDAGDIITQASVNALPANTWVKVAGSTMQSLESAIQAANGFTWPGDDYGNAVSVRTTFSAWVGCCVAAEEILFPVGGGHADSSCNGIWRLAARSMRWGVVDPPSLADAPGFEWDVAYLSDGTLTSYTYEPPAFDGTGITPDMLPDGKPTSRHTYNGVCYDSTRDAIVIGRISKWQYFRQTSEWVRNRWTVGGTPVVGNINQQMHYHAGTDTIYGYMSAGASDYFNFRKVAADSSAIVNETNPPNWRRVGIASVRLDEDHVLFFWSREDDDRERAGIFNMHTQAWQPGAGDLVVNGRNFTTGDEMAAALYVPSWGDAGQVIRRGGGGATSAANIAWWLYDIATNTNSAYTPAGAVPSTAKHPGNKYLSLSQLGIALLIDDQAAITEPAVYVMRYE